MSISAPDSEIPLLPGDIRVWAGWPLFDIKVVQFEMNQWMQAAGLIDGPSDIIRPHIDSFYSTLHEEVEHAEAGLLKIMDWNRGPL